MVFVGISSRSLSSKQSRLAEGVEAGSLKVEPVLGCVDGCLVKILGSHFGGGRGGLKTVRVYTVVCGSVSPSGSKYGPSAIVAMFQYESIRGLASVGISQVWFAQTQLRVLTRLQSGRYSSVGLRGY
jgi:hypothetical protein